MRLFGVAQVANLVFLSVFENEEMFVVQVQFRAGDSRNGDADICSGAGLADCRSHVGFIIQLKRA